MTHTTAQDDKQRAFERSLNPAQSTPIPWAHNYGVGPITSIHAENGDHVCTVRESCNVNCEANAELITRAVNCHAELLAALENMLRCADAGDLDSLANASDDARAAIAKATA